MSGSLTEKQAQLSRLDTEIARLERKIAHIRWLILGDSKPSPDEGEYAPVIPIPVANQHGMLFLLQGDAKERMVQIEAYSQKIDARLKTLIQEQEGALSLERP